MKLENQVCTLEQALKLKRWGIKQESLFYYSESASEGNWFISDKKLFDGISAFTVAELGVMLPDTMLNTCIPEDLPEAVLRADALIMTLHEGLRTVEYCNGQLAAA